MQSQLIASTIAFICAWSQPHCDAIANKTSDEGYSTKFPITLEQNPNNNSGKLAYGITTILLQNGKFSRPLKIVLNNGLDDVPFTGKILAHESDEIMRQVTKDGCPFEGYNASEDYQTWFSQTFGEPSISKMTTTDYYAWNSHDRCN